MVYSRRLYWRLSADPSGPIGMVHIIGITPLTDGEKNREGARLMIRVPRRLLRTGDRFRPE